MINNTFNNKTVREAVANPYSLHANNAYIYKNPLNTGNEPFAIFQYANSYKREQGRQILRDAGVMAKNITYTFESRSFANRYTMTVWFE